MQKKEIIKKLIKEIEELKDKRGYIQAGSPHFKGLFGRDSLIVAWQLLKYDPLIAKKTISILAKFQGKKEDIKTGEEPGKILHEYYPDDTPDDWWDKHKKKVKWLKKGKPVYMSVDSTPLFLIVLGMYLDITRDFDFAYKIKSNIKNAVDWMIKYGDKDKDLFLEYERKDSEGLFHQAWKDSDMDELKVSPPVSVAEAQGYQYLALKESAKIMRKLKEINFSNKCTKRANNLKKKFNDIFWSKEKKYFIFALTKDNKKIDKITSNPGHLLFTGIISKEKSKKVIDKLFSNGMKTLYGIRTYSTKELEFNPFSYQLGGVWPHDNWIIAQGLKKLGYENRYQEIKKSIIKAYKKLGFLPELYSVDEKNSLIEYDGACYPQAWSSGSLLNFLISK